MGRMPSRIEIAKKKRAINEALIKSSKGDTINTGTNQRTVPKKPSILSTNKVLVKRLKQTTSRRFDRAKLNDSNSRISYSNDSKKGSENQSNGGQSNWLVKAVARLAGDQQNR